MDTDRPQRIGFLLLDGFPLVPFALASEILRAADRIGGGRLYALRRVPASGAQARAASGVIVPADAQVGESVDYDALLVLAPDEPPAASLRLLGPWLRALSRRGVRLGGIGGGVAVLADAGLLTGRRVAV